MLLSAQCLPLGRRTVLLAFLLAFLLTGRLSATTILYQASPLGGNVFQLTYLVNDLTFSANQELDIEFDPALFSLLSNGTAGSDFDLLLFQPNNPLGSVGLYAALALIDNPSLSSPFQVNAVYLGPGSPGPQRFSLAEFDGNRELRQVLQTGSTTQSSPEPSVWSLTVLGLIACGACRASLRRRIVPSSTDSPARLMARK